MRHIHALQPWMLLQQGAVSCTRAIGPRNKPPTANTVVTTAAAAAAAAAATPFTAPFIPAGRPLTIHPAAAVAAAAMSLERMWRQKGGGGGGGGAGGDALSFHA
eukprot:1159239-Pelagomonas_calceolata.AAC.6